jgi:hypothetical protein
VHRPGRRLDRLVLLAYPRSFRREYGDEITRTIDDLRHHRGVRGWRLGLRVTGDLLAAAPRLRLESSMTKTRALPVLVGVALVALSAAAAMVLGAVVVFVVPVVLVGLAIALTVRHDRPLATEPASSNRWAAWAAGGGAAILASLAIARAAGEDASEPIWVLWAMTTLAGLTMSTIALVTGTGRFARRRAA